jgi:hypothetical protein
MPLAKPHPEEMARLGTCSERFRPMAFALYEEINRRCIGEDCSPLVVFGARSAQEQLTIWMEGRRLIANGADIWNPKSWAITNQAAVRTWKFPGFSPHQTGDACDIALVVGPLASRHWLADSDPRWKTINQQAAIAVGATWGGSFKGFFDAAHFQHPAWVEPKR